MTDKVKPIRAALRDAIPGEERWEDGRAAANENAQKGPIPLATIGADDLFAPLPPIDWACEALGLTSGAASALIGFGFVGKTVVAQSILLAVASGRPLWDLFSVAKGRALHVDFEQGRRLTSERYQRLALGSGIHRDELEDNLHAAIMPAVYLDSPLAADVYARTFEGFRFAVVDSLRAAAPSADENASDVRRHIDVLTRASEMTGCTPLLLHHARKPNDNATGGAKMSIRGSSAIFDSLASAFVLEAEKGKPTRVHHEKDRVRGVLMPDFGLQIEDVAIGDNPRAGLHVRHLEAEQLTVLSERPAVDKRTVNQEKIRDFFRKAGNPTFAGGVKALRAVVGVRQEDFSQAFEPMKFAGEFTVAGSFHKPTITWRGEA